MRTNGFTLVELLAAMVAGSLLLVALSAFTGSMASEVRQSATVKEASRLAEAAPTLDRLLSGLLPGDGDRPAIDIQADSLSGHIAAPQALGPVGKVRLLLDVRREADGEALFLTLSPETEGGALPEAASSPVKLIGGFRAIDFSPVRTGYRPSEGPILISFTGGKGDHRTMAFTPKVTSSGACRFDVISMACR